MSQVAHIRIALVALFLGGSLAGLGAVGRATAAIYWQNEGAIGRANLDGSNLDPEFIRFPVLPGSDGYVICGGIALDSEYIYWADNQHGTIGRARLDGSDVRGSFISDVGSPCGIAVDASHVYWANFDGGSIGRANLDGTNADHALVDSGIQTCGLAISASNLFWSNARNEIARASLGGTEPIEPLIAGADACGLMTLGNHLYWADFDGSIGRATLNGTEENRSLVTDLLHPCGIVIHDAKIYWTEGPPFAVGSIGRAGIDGSSVERGIVPGIRSPCGIAVDDLTVPPKPVPVPGEFFLGLVRHSRRSAATFVRLTVSMRGKLTISVPRGIQYRFLDGAGEVDPGSHWLKLSARPGSRDSWPHIGLRRHGVQFTLAAGYLPAVGQTKFIAKKVSLVRARSGRPKR